MDQGNNSREDGEEQDPAVKSFEAMRAGLGADLRELTRAVKDLTAAQATALRPFDYSPTLNKIMGDMETIATSPLLKVSYNDVARQVGAVVEQVKRDASNTINSSEKALDRAVAELRDITAVTREARMQNWLLGVAVLVGALLWGFFGGAVLRATPDSWGWPEKAAARMLDMPIWDAGLHLAAMIFPDSSVGMSTGLQIVRANKQAIAACQKAAEKAGKPVPCMLQVPAAENLADAS